jgi:hypothetical protein
MLNFFKKKLPEPAPYKCPVCAGRGSIEKPPKVKKDQHVLRIILKDKSDYTYSHVHEYNSGKNVLTCFMPFYKWFYYRKSPYYSLEHTNGYTIFKRSQISTIELFKTVIFEECKL